MIFSLFKKYIWLINIILIVAIAYLVASMFNNRLKSEIFSPEKFSTSERVENSKNKFAVLDQKKYNRTYYDLILKRNIFGGTNSTTSGSSLQSKNDSSAPETSLNIELLGTYLNYDGDSIAVIKNLDNEKVRGYSDGQIIDVITNESVKLLGVDNCKVLIDRRAKGTETVECKRDFNLAKSNSSQSRNSSTRNSSSFKTSKSDSGIKQVNENEFQIERKMLDELLEDPTSILNQARVVPQKDGLRFFGIRRSSIFFKIGLRNGDIVHKINEVELNDVQNALGIFGSLKDQSQFSVDFTRRGKKHSYAYNVN